MNNIASYYKKCATEEREHALKFIDYQNQRGGTVELVAINFPKILLDLTLINDNLYDI